MTEHLFSPEPGAWANRSKFISQETLRPPPVAELPDYIHRSQAAALLALCEHHLDSLVAEKRLGQPLPDGRFHIDQLHAFNASKSGHLNLWGVAVDAGYKGWRFRLGAVENGKRLPSQLVHKSTGEHLVFQFPGEIAARFGIDPSTRVPPGA